MAFPKSSYTYVVDSNMHETVFSHIITTTSLCMGSYPSVSIHFWTMAYFMIHKVNLYNLLIYTFRTVVIKYCSRYLFAVRSEMIGIYAHLILLWRCLMIKEIFNNVYQIYNVLEIQLCSHWKTWWIQNVLYFTCKKVIIAYFITVFYNKLIVA